jgi:hypothetical protein
MCHIRCAQICSKYWYIRCIKKTPKIGAYLELDITNIAEVKEAIYLYSDVTVGIQFPDSAMTQFNNGGIVIWDVVPKAKIEGAHDVPLYGSAIIVGYKDGIFYLDTWDKIIGMTLAFFKKYVDEGYVILSPEFLNSQGVSPEGFDLPTLQADMSALPNQPPAPLATLPTHVAVDPISGQSGSKVMLTAEVIETDNTKYLPGESVNFSIGDVAVGTAITDKTGKASLPYGLTQKAGSYPITVQFAGDSNFAASNGNNTLNVTSTPVISPSVAIANIKTIMATSSKITKAKLISEINAVLAQTGGS